MTKKEPDAKVSGSFLILLNVSHGRDGWQSKSRGIPWLQLRSDAERKRVLIKKLGSKKNNVATEALHEVDAEGRLLDGSLRRAFLLSCNLDGNTFTDADLKQVSFGFASLRDTTWFEADLTGVYLDFVDFTGTNFTILGCSKLGKIA